MLDTVGEAKVLSETGTILLGTQNTGEDNIRLLPPDKVDKITTMGMIHAKKKSRKFRTGKVYYSPKVSEAGRLLSLWNLVLRAWTRGGVKNAPSDGKPGVVACLAQSHLL